MSKFCLSDAHYDRYDRRKHNFPYRKLFTPDLNVFPYTKVIYLSVISVIYRKDGIRKYAISASQMIHLDNVNETFKHQKQYVSYVYHTL